MANIAVLVGNSQYRFLRNLSCCHDDLLAMRELLDATKKYSEIDIIENTDSDALKSKMRDLIGKYQTTEELFFYFTGHGYLQEDEFYHCATNFNSKRPNETGISVSELHTYLRQVNADLVVKVIDACNAGTPLIKAEGEFVQQQKDGFKNLIQIASCLQFQNSFTGEPLSIFTEKFRTSALRKEKGVIYYIDFFTTLRDEFLQNNDQTPYFVSQVTGKEQFVDDAKLLDMLRDKLTVKTESSTQSESVDQQTLPTVPNLQTMLKEAERNAATPEKIMSFVNTFFDDLIEKVSSDESSDFFDLVIVENADFSETTAEAFIIRVLSKESRSDEFVTAKISKEEIHNPWKQLVGSLAALMYQRYRDVYDLRLNCSMQRAQLKITFTPKFHSLKQLVLVVTCAPSLQYCYVFEVVSQHSLKDFGEFDEEGDEVIRRWYKFRWSDNTDHVVTKITLKLYEIVQEHLEHTKQILFKE